MKKIIMLTAALFIASACAAIASAQTFGEMNADRPGTGYIRLENQREEPLTNATVILRRNGEAEVRLTGRTTTTFTGRWRANNDNSVDLTLTNGFGYGTTEARGSVTLTRGGGFDRLELNGRSRGRTFSVSFDAERRTGPFPGGGIGGNRNSEFIGTYRSSYGSQRGGTDTRFIRVLKVMDDGRVELVSRYQGRDPDLTRADLSMHGSLLRDIRSRKKITHSGTWRAIGRRLDVTLSDLDGNRVPGRWTFEFRNNDRNELITTAWDRSLYGSVGFEFKRTDTPDDDDSDQGPGQDPGQSPNRLAGTYSTRLQVPDTDGEIERTLQLLPNGDARLTTEWVGGRTPRIGFRAQRELGRSIRDLENQRTITQNGRWQYRDRQVVVDFDNLDRTRERGTITFDVRGITSLESVSMDQSIFGDRRFTLTRTTR